MIRFFIPGEPQAQKRHRHTGAGHVYDPSAKDKKRFQSASLMHKPPKPLSGPLQVKVYFIFSRPKSHYGTGRNATKLKPSAPTYFTKKPDTSNLLKFVEDAYNGMFWGDDSQIVLLTGLKRYVDADNKPGTIIVIEEV